MSIQKDAGELLALIYSKYESNTQVFKLVSDDLDKDTGWEQYRIVRAIEYLKDAELISAYPSPQGRIKLCSNYLIFRPTPKGIDIIENKPKFQRQFGFEVGLPGVFKFSWGAQEK